MGISETVNEFRVPNDVIDKFCVQVCPVVDIEKVIESKIEEQASEDPFYIVNLQKIVDKYVTWKNLLPRVKPFYAVKCNPHPGVISTLAGLGTGFDCASLGEVKQVASLGVDPETRILYANPCKQASNIIGAVQMGVKRMTFDNADELIKIKKIAPGSELILRVLPDDSRSLCKFGVKFGAHQSTWKSLIELSIKLELKLIGISFHVGSGCYDASAFADALDVARRAFDLAETLGLRFTVLDIGGGFPGTDGLIKFPEIASLMRPKLDALFPPEVEVIAEPGRYFVAASHTLITSVVARREMIVNVPSEDSEDEEEQISYLYYINDGCYGSFNNQMFDHAINAPMPLKLSESTDVFKSTVFGPTCDSIDCIVKEKPLQRMEVGDWLYFKDMGAYTIAAASCFNGFSLTKIYFIAM